MLTGQKYQTPTQLKGKRSPRFLFLPGSLNYPATSCIICCLNHPDKLISTPGTCMEADIILSPFALEPMKSHSLHHEDTSRPCSRRASYTPSHAQLTAGCRAPGRGTHLPPMPFRAGPWAHTGRRWPHATGAQGWSPARRAGPGAWLLCLLPTPTFPHRRRPCVHKPARTPRWGRGGDTAAGTNTQTMGSLSQRTAKATQRPGFPFTPFTPILFWVAGRGEGRKHV